MMQYNRVGLEQQKVKEDRLIWLWLVLSQIGLVISILLLIFRIQGFK